MRHTVGVVLPPSRSALIVIMPPMPSQNIQYLLEPPDVAAAHRSALRYLDSTFPCIDHLDGLDEVLLQTKTRSSELQRQVGWFFWMFECNLLVVS